MSKRWQQWMPFHIDAFKSSPGVRAMHPAARSGYLYLLAFAWQTEDCTIPSDPLELAEISELGDELWTTHGPRILRKFEQTATGRMRNESLFEKWSEAKKVYDSRSSGAERTNRQRSPNGHRENNDGHRTPTDYAPVLVGVSVPVAVEEKPELDHVDVARRVGEECKITSTAVIREIQEQAKLELADGRTPADLVAELTGAIEGYRAEKPKLRIIWGMEKFIGEGHWRDPPSSWPHKEKSRKQQISEWRAPDEED